MTEEFHPVTPARLDDLRSFSLRHGKFRYCSCMRWRLTSSEFQASTRDDRIKRLADAVAHGTPVGVLGYRDGQAVGWCSMAPLSTYGALLRSKSIPRVDTEPVWSVVCFFLDRTVRGSGFRDRLLRAAVTYAQSQGARMIEAYPIDPAGSSYQYMGNPPLYERAGFVRVAESPPYRTVMRLRL